MPTVKSKKNQHITFTKGERAARRDAEEAMRMGLPITPTTARHLATARRKMNLLRYGKGDVA